MHNSVHVKKDLKDTDSSALTKLAYAFVNTAPQAGDNSDQ